MKKIITIICTLFFFCTVNAQIHIKGNVIINMNSGLIICDFNLSNIPQIEDYRILLNKGMNIKNFKNSNHKLVDYEGHYNGKTQGEAIEYTLRNHTKHIPATFNITYKGAFPIYKDEYNTFDYKGIIAFNGETVRASEQTKWYPVIYDVANDKLIDSYTYDLTISIEGGSTIFINGSSPQKVKFARFVSNTAYPLLLFAGNYDFIENKGNYIINTSVNKKTAEKVFNNIGMIKSVLAKNIGMQFTDNIYLINHRAVNKRKAGSSWGFNTYPAFAFTALNFDYILDEKGNFTNNNFKYFGHEFGHNYFGNNVMSGKLRWFWLESFAEYLSYIVVAELCNEKFLNKVLIKQAKSIKQSDNFIQLNKIKNANEIGEKYRYILAPLMLKCFEDQFGRDKMNLTIKYLLEFAKDVTLTLRYWKKAAIKSGISIKEFKQFENKFISNKRFKKNIISEILKNHS